MIKLPDWIKADTLPQYYKRYIGEKMFSCRGNHGIVSCQIFKYWPNGKNIVRIEVRMELKTLTDAVSLASEIKDIVLGVVFLSK